jgi:hypothetical protein
MGRLQLHRGRQDSACTFDEVADDMVCHVGSRGQDDPGDVRADQRCFGTQVDRARVRSMVKAVVFPIALANAANETMASKSKRDAGIIDGV